MLPPRDSDFQLNEVDGATLFPGFDGVARVIRERVYWDGSEGTDSRASGDELNGRRMALAERYLQKVPIYSEADIPIRMEDIGLSAT